MNVVSKTYTVENALGDRMEVQVQQTDEALQVRLIRLEGCEEFQALAQSWITQSSSGTFKGFTAPAVVSPANGVQKPESAVSHGQLLLWQLESMIQGQWKAVDPQRELCHCRAVPAAHVDRAILAGCRSVRAVSRATGAGTSCGTCQPEISELLDARLTKPDFPVS